MADEPRYGVLNRLPGDKRRPDPRRAIHVVAEMPDPGGRHPYIGWFLCIRTFHTERDDLRSELAPIQGVTRLCRVCYKRGGFPEVPPGKAGTIRLPSKHRP